MGTRVVKDVVDRIEVVDRPSAVGRVSVVERASAAGRVGVLERASSVSRTLLAERARGVKRALPGLAAVLLAACGNSGTAAAPAGSAAGAATAPSAPGAHSGTAAQAPPADSAARAAERVIHVTAKKFEYSPSEIHVKKGEPVVLEFVSLDRKHGFEAPDLGLSTEIDPKAPSRVRFVPQKEGRFPFHCSVFCGDGHEDMTGEIVVEP